MLTNLRYLVIQRRQSRIMPDRFAIGDVVEMKKPHPCGSKEWEVLRTGADFRIKCKGCGHTVMIPRTKFEKGVKKILISNVKNEDE